MKPKKSTVTFGALEGALNDGAQADGAGGALADEDAAALARDDEAFFAQDADRLLDGHARDAVALGELVAGRQLVARLELLGQDRGAQCAGDLDVGRARVVVWIEADAAHDTGNWLVKLVRMSKCLTWLAMLVLCCFHP